MIDPQQFQNAILNLVINARDAMPKGGTLSVETSSGDENIEIKIADTGVGIKDEHINKIFDSFFTTKDSVKGVGLGPGRRPAGSAGSAGNRGAA